MSKNVQEETNPVLSSAHFAYQQTNLVHIDPEGVQAAAKYIFENMSAESYSPKTWRTHPLHIIPPMPYNGAHCDTRRSLDFIFLISTLNFSFWSEKEGTPCRYAVAWDPTRNPTAGVPSPSWTGYFSLLAAINRAVDAGISILEPSFYSSPIKCPDSMLKSIFNPSRGWQESIPLLKERIAILREVGSIMCTKFGGSYQSLLGQFKQQYSGAGTALELVKLIADNFPSFRDEMMLNGRKVFFWKRAQILVAETWAAFYPEDIRQTHPLLPGGVSDLTMFADYRVPQILQQLRVLSYPSNLTELLESRSYIPSGSAEEVSIRSASILAVEQIRDAIARNSQIPPSPDAVLSSLEMNSVIIDFWLWEMAKKIESGDQSAPAWASLPLPPHRTRSIYY